MFSLESRNAPKLCDGISRRELMRVGGLSAFGLGLPDLLRATEATAPGVLPTDKTFGRAKNLIYLFLHGGPPQHETFDPKPGAPEEVRGPFKPIQTNIPGIQFCELLPRTSMIADKLAVVRSLSTDDNIHSSSGYWVMTGYKYQGPNARTIQPTDWSYFGSVVKMLKPSETLPPFSCVWLPQIMRLNESVTPAGQTDGFLGGEWNPDRFLGNPSRPDYKVDGLELSDLPPLRLERRRSLLSQVEEHFTSAKRDNVVQVYDKFQQQAFDLLTSDKARDAFAIEKEPPKLRERYGNNEWGQSCLVARRLIEAGARMVHVNWPRVPGDNASDNPLWDTHAQNADRVEDVLCPTFDVSFSALIEDLDRRGMLDETLVVAIGEFGRTPKINAKGGRDHWGPVFSFVMAGAGVSGGQVYGASDKQGAYPAEDKIRPGELTATLFHLMGIDPTGTFHDREGREHRLTEGATLSKLLGTEPATYQRVRSTGNIARVPPPGEHMLLNMQFTDAVALRTFEGPSRPKGWRVSHVLKGNDRGLGVKHHAINPAGLGTADSNVSIGFGLGDKSAENLTVDKGQRAVLAQEVISPFPGTYTFRIHATAGATSKEVFEQVFRKHFMCRLQLFQFTEKAKSPAQRKELAGAEIQPQFTADGSLQSFEVTKKLLNPKPGSNFSFGLGMGVAVILEKKTDGQLTVPDSQQAFLTIDRVEIDFVGKERDKNVTS